MKTASMKLVLHMYTLGILPLNIHEIGFDCLRCRTLAANRRIRKTIFYA